jgi:hypothetical protein
MDNMSYNSRKICQEQQPLKRIIRASVLCFCFIGLALFIATSGCAGRVLRNVELWYWLSVPKNWKAGKDGLIKSDQGDLLRISRWRDDSPLERFVDSQRRAIQIDRAGFVIEDETWINVARRKSWKMVGTHRQTDINREDTWVYVIVDTGQYKYMLEFITPSEQYLERRTIIDGIVRSFGYKIPEY